MRRQADEWRILEKASVPDGRNVKCGFERGSGHEAVWRWSWVGGWERVLGGAGVQALRRSSVRHLRVGGEAVEGVGREVERS